MIAYFTVKRHSAPALSKGRLKGIIKAAKAPLLLVSDPANMRYILGAAVESGFAFVSASRIDLFADVRYAAEPINFEPHIYLHHPQDLKQFLHKQKRIAVEDHHITLRQIRSLQRKYKSIKFAQTSGLFSGLRRCKSESEILCIREACAITHRLLAAVPRLLKIGVSEGSVALELERLAFNYGADGMAFQTIVGFGKNTARPHHRPTRTRLKRGDLVQIDIGVKVRGYCSDYSRVFFTSDPTPEQLKVFRALQRAKKSAQTLMRTGTINHVIDAAARAELRKADIEEYFIHSLGHSVGLEIHDGFRISSKGPKEKLVENDVVTIEPGVYFEGEWGMRIEDTILVTKRGCKVL